MQTNTPIWWRRLDSYFLTTYDINFEHVIMQTNTPISSGRLFFFYPIQSNQQYPKNLICFIWKILNFLQLEKNFSSLILSLMQEWNNNTKTNLTSLMQLPYQLQQNQRRNPSLSPPIINTSQKLSPTNLNKAKNNQEEDPIKGEGDDQTNH